jgi:hypothetical protein
MQCPVTASSLDSLRIWLASDTQQTPTLSKLSLGLRHSTLASYTSSTSLGATMTKMLKCQWWLRGGLMCTSCHPRSISYTVFGWVSVTLFLDTSLHLLQKGDYAPLSLLGRVQNASIIEIRSTAWAKFESQRKPDTRLYATSDKWINGLIRTRGTWNMDPIAEYNTWVLGTWKHFHLTHKPSGHCLRHSPRRLCTPLARRRNIRAAIRAEVNNRIIQHADFLSRVCFGSFSSGLLFLPMKQPYEQSKL